MTGIITASTPWAKKARSKAQPEGRTCLKRGCRTLLSIYNEGDRCGVHEAEAVIDHEAEMKRRRDERWKDRHGHEPRWLTCPCLKCKYAKFHHETERRKARG